MELWKIKKKVNRMLEIKSYSNYKKKLKRDGREYRFYRLSKTSFIVLWNICKVPAFLVKKRLG